jgi:hypothetical protein
MAHTRGHDPRRVTIHATISGTPIRRAVKVAAAQETAIVMTTRAILGHARATAMTTTPGRSDAVLGTNGRDRSSMGLQWVDVVGECDSVADGVATISAAPSTSCCLVSSSQMALASMSCARSDRNTCRP